MLSAAIVESQYFQCAPSSEHTITSPYKSPILYSGSSTLLGLTSAGDSYMAEAYTHSYTIIDGRERDSAVVQWDGERGTIVFVGPMRACKDWLVKNGTPEPIIPGEYDCQACGACCRAYFSRVNLTPADLARMAGHESATRRLTIFNDAFGDHQAFITRPDGRCEALDGDGPYSCGIYEVRPQACRAVEPGSPACLSSRKACNL